MCSARTFENAEEKKHKKHKTYKEVMRRGSFKLKTMILMLLPTYLAFLTFPEQEVLYIVIQYTLYITIKGSCCFTHFLSFF